MAYLEQFITHLLNENEGKAVELLRKHIIDKAREIHESLRQDDDAVLAEGWDQELVSEDYFTESDLDDAVVDGDDATDDLQGDLDGETGEGDVPEMEGDDLGDADMGDDDMGADSDLASEVSDMKATLDRLVDELDEFINNGGGSDDDTGDFDNEISSDVDADVDADLDGDMGDDAGDYGDTNDDLTDDMSDDDDTVKEAADDFDDITESIIDELEKVTVPNDDGRQQGNGKTPQNTKSPTSSRSSAPKPVTIKSKNHTGFARETEPTSADRKRYRNNMPKAEDGRSKVSKEGDASATLNKPNLTPNKSPIASPGRAPVSK